MTRKALRRGQEDVRHQAGPGHDRPDFQSWVGLNFGHVCLSNYENKS